MSGLRRVVSAAKSSLDGQRIRHKVHGLGTVICKDPEDWLTVMVQFDGESRQTAMDLLEPDLFKVLSPLECLAEQAD